MKILEGYTQNPELHRRISTLMSAEERRRPQATKAAFVGAPQFASTIPCLRLRTCTQSREPLENGPDVRGLPPLLAESQDVVIDSST